MINDKEKWYHYLMVPYTFQLAVVVACVIIILLQYAAYSKLDKPETVFNDECVVDIMTVQDKQTGDETGSEYKGLKLQCGNDTLYHSALDGPYLYELLTSERQPAIVCEHKVSKYLKDESWSCKLKKTDKE